MRRGSLPSAVACNADPACGALGVIVPGKSRVTLVLVSCQPPRAPRADIAHAQSRLQTPACYYGLFFRRNRPDEGAYVCCTPHQRLGKPNCLLHRINRKHAEPGPGWHRLGPAYLQVCRNWPPSSAADCVGPSPARTQEPLPVSPPLQCYMATWAIPFGQRRAGRRVFIFRSPTSEAVEPLDTFSAGR